ncbi:MAG: NUDIX hydrolase, partial [Pseudonocardiaceae bacterium]
MSRPGPLVDSTSVPEWLALLVHRTAELGPGDLGPMPAPPEAPPQGARAAAVLVLFAEDSHTGEPDVLLALRADQLSSHAGQVCFPGG